MIFHEQALDTLKKLDDESVDCVVTSPPYNKEGYRGGGTQHANDFKADIDYDDHNDDMPEDEYWAWQNNLLNELYRVLTPSGSVFYNHKVRRHDQQAHHPLMALDNDLTFYQQIIWDRRSTVDHNQHYLDPTTELVLWFVKDSPNVYKNDVDFKTPVWSIPPESGNDHPAPFPVELAVNCIMLTTERDDLVYDPFMGSGTTALACERTNRTWIGSEISQQYIDQAEERIRAEQDQLTIFD